MKISKRKEEKNMNKIKQNKTRNGLTEKKESEKKREKEFILWHSLCGPLKLLLVNCYCEMGHSSPNKHHAMNSDLVKHLIW